MSHGLVLAVIGMTRRGKRGGGWDNEEAANFGGCGF